MVYDYYVPIFNLNRILSEEGNVLFEAYAIGKISSSEDTSFQDFKGFQNLPDLNAKDKQIDLSTQWTVYAEDMQMIGEDAIWFKMYLNTETPLDNEDNWFPSLVYTTFLSSDDMIIYAPSIYVSEFGKFSKLRYLVYSKEDDIKAVWCAPSLPEHTLIPCDDGYIWKEVWTDEGGDNTYYTEKICENIYYYEAHF
jgi:hypothetical protein